MYCEKCKRIVDADRCPFCKGRRTRAPEPDDICFLTEQDYVFSGILEDVLQQKGIRFLKKDVMGAGMAIKVGPMLERSRFYVPFSQMEDAAAIVEEIAGSSGKERSQTMKTTVKIEGMMCGHCEAAVKKALEALPFVESAEVSHVTGTAELTLSGALDEQAVKAAVEEKDFTYLGIA